MRGGICQIHEEGAVRKWKPSSRKIVSKDGGTSVASYTREYYYVCDLGPEGGRKTVKTVFWP